jgi:predicted ATPase/DNA-binding winged helix-turn-helix (wHTH) protein
MGPSGNTVRPTLTLVTTAASSPGRRSSERYLLGADLCLDVGRQRLERDGAEIPLPKLSFDFLLALVRAAPNVATLDELMAQVWPGLVVQPETVSQRAKLLRDALGDDAQSPTVIRGVRGRGYVLACAVQQRVLDEEAMQHHVAPAATTRPASPSETPDSEGSSGLPFAPNPLLGRDDDLAVVRELLASHRVVTVVGSGGIGKTRLALSVAHAVAASFRHGVSWVDLAALSGEVRLATAIANAARLQLRDRDAPEQLAQALVARHSLLVMDNCEHLVDSAALFVEGVLAAAPGVRILVTSQLPLKVAGEQIYRIGPLATPPPGSKLEAARASGAMQLLEQRVHAIDHTFALDSGNVGDAAELCRHLDGMPLAIEMAAARVPTLGLAALCNHLEGRLQLLRASRRGAPARQQTLRATLDWSHSLLDPNERAALRRLSAFAGSFCLEAACTVVATDELDRWTALDALSGLVEKSLVHAEQREPPRFRLLESTRAYASEALSAAGEVDDTAKRYGATMAALADAAESAFWMESDAEWLARFTPDYDNLHAAFDHAARIRDADVAAATGNALQRLDVLRNVHMPIRRRAEAALALLPGAGARARALLLNCVAPHSVIAISVADRLNAAREAVATWEELGDIPQLYVAQGLLASQLARSGEHDAARAAIERARSLEDAVWPARRRMRGAEFAAAVSNYRGDAAGYRANTRMELALAERAGSPRTAAWCRLKLADAALMAGDVQEAIALAEEAVAQLGDLDQPSHRGLALTNLAEALVVDGQEARAREVIAQALPLMWANGWGHLPLDTLAVLAASAGDTRTSASVLGYVDTYYSVNRETRQPNEARLAARTVALLDAACVRDGYTHWHAEGAALANDHARTLAERWLNRESDCPDARERP